MRRSLAVIAVVPALLASASAYAQAPAGQSRLAGTGATGSAYVPGQVVVQYRDGTTASRHAQVRGTAGTARVERLGLAQTEVVRAPAGTTPPQAAAELLTDPAVEHATPNWVARNLSIPNDPLFNRQWALRNTGLGVNAFPFAALPGSDIGATSAWDTTIGSPSVKVAVMDTGIDSELPDFAGQVDQADGYDFVDDDTDPFDENEHGTHVAGIIGARGDDGVGVSGVAQRVSLIADRVLDADGSGTLGSALDGIAHAGQVGARVANGSYGFEGGSSQLGPMLQSAIAKYPNTLFVFAAGNGGKAGVGDDVDKSHNGEEEIFPCEVPNANVLCVAATDQADRLASFSNYGTTSVDLGAPGVDVISDWPRHVYFGYGPLEKETLDNAWPVDRRGGWGATTDGPFEGIDGPGIADSPSGDYQLNAETTVESRDIDIPSGATGCTVESLVDLDLEAGAKVRLRLAYLDSPRPAETILDRAGPQHIFGLALSKPLELGGHKVRVSATVYSSGATKADDGLELSATRVECDPQPGVAGSYQYLNGTSMATPQVTGAAALLLAKRPDLSVAQLRTALLTTGDPVSSLQGLTVTGRRLDVGAALASLPSIGSRPNTTAAAVGGAQSSSSAPRLVALSLGGLPGSLQLDRSGKATIAVTGTPGAAGQLTVRTANPVVAASAKRKKKSVLTLATKRFSIGASGKTRVGIKVSGKALRTLRKAKRLRSTVTVKAGSRTVSRATTVRAPKGKRTKAKTKRR